MGQARNRGSREQRVAQAKERLEALKPKYLTCNNCDTDIYNVHAMDGRGMVGIEAAFAGVCPECGQATWAFQGDDDAVALAMAAIEESSSGEAS